MAAKIPTTEPLEIFAGDSLRFRKQLNKFPAPDWSLEYTLVAQSGTTAVRFSASADGTGHLIDLPRQTTAAWEPGEYRLIGLISSATERGQIFADVFFVNPNPETVSAYDGSTQKERNLEAVEKVLAENLARGVEKYSNAGASAVLQTVGHASMVRDPDTGQLIPFSTHYDGGTQYYARQSISQGLLRDRSRLRSEIRAEQKRIGKRTPHRTKGGLNNHGFVKVTFKDPLSPKDRFGNPI